MISRLGGVCPDGIQARVAVPHVDVAENRIGARPDDGVYRRACFGIDRFGTDSGLIRRQVVASFSKLLDQSIDLATSTKLIPT
jgi:hypothetical protein